jgi:1-hydroxycarotenoid 3,4-desaturase
LAHFAEASHGKEGQGKSGLGKVDMAGFGLDTAALARSGQGRAPLATSGRGKAELARSGEGKAEPARSGECKADPGEGDRGKSGLCTAGIDAGPTVFTMRWVFERLFESAGTSLEKHLTLRPLDVLARHAWSGHETLDLFADVDRTADAIGSFAGASEAAGYRDFCTRAERVYRALEGPFIRSPRPTAVSLAAGSGLRGIKDMWGISPFTTLWRALGEHFHDKRLRQLFGRYATYSGSSPFEAPATLMLIAHVEQQGVWSIDGGMVRLAEAMAGLATHLGAAIRHDTTVAEIVVRNRRAAGVVLASGERIEADAIVCGADCAALSAGLFGQAAIRAVPRSNAAARSLSAVTWALSATTSGFPLTRHNVFFSRDYAAEFDAILRRGTLPIEPTVYVCAQDRGGVDPEDRGGVDRQDRDGVGRQDRGRLNPAPRRGPERLLVLINAPANGDHHEFTAAEIEQCATRTFGVLARCGLTVDRRTEATSVTTPSDFGKLFPATGGALYGQAVHGAMAAFRRPGARSSVPGLYLAGGSVHPGPGVPMAALSGRLAASSVLKDLTSD